MGRLPFYLLFLFSFQFCALGQNKAVSSAIKLYEDGKHDEALKKLDAALADTKLDSKSLALASYYKGQIIEQGEGPGRKYIDAAQLYYTARRNYKDLKGKHQKAIYAAVKKNYNMLLVQSNALYRFPEQATEYSAAAMKNHTWVELNTQYIAPATHANNLLGTQDTLKAYSLFKKSLPLYNYNKPEKPDYIQSYSYYRLSLISRYSKHNLDSAMYWIEEGMEFCKSELARTDDATVKKNLEEAQEEINKLKLDILLTDRNRLEQGLIEFKNRVEQNPQDYIAHVGYAQLLESAGDLEKALQMYEKALKLRPDGFLVNYNLGAIYVNLGAALKKEAVLMEDFDASQAKSDESIALIKKGIPFLEKAHIMKPMDIWIIRELKNLSATIEDMDRYKKYSEALKKLQGQ